MKSVNANLVKKLAYFFSVRIKRTKNYTINYTTFLLGLFSYCDKVKYKTLIQRILTVEFCSLSFFSRRPKAPAFVFLSPLEPKWTHLRSIIPNVLQLSVIGYPFINPGAVGGVPSGNPTNGSDDVTQQLQEDLELYVRWWQLNTFLPMLHFIKPPSAFPATAVRIFS